MIDEDPDEPAAAFDPFAGPDWHKSGSTPTLGPDGEPIRRRVRVNRRKRRRRRRLGVAVMIAGGLIVLSGAWLVITGLMARH